MTGAPASSPHHYSVFARISKKQWNHPVPPRHHWNPSGRNEAGHSQTGLIDFRQVDLVFFATFAFLICYVYQINLDWIRWARAFCLKRIGSGLYYTEKRMVKDANGNPIEGADIRIATKIVADYSRPLKQMQAVVTVLEGLPVGNYRVTYGGEWGGENSSVNNTTVQPSESTQLNFDLTHERASVTVKKGKHWVWIPAFTGSRLPGHWVEIDDSGSWAGEA